MNNINPWFQLDPNNHYERWWRITEIIDETQNPDIDINNVKCYFIIQDCNMCGNIWHVSCWYNYCPNRYSTTISKSDWFLNKQLSDISEGDVVCLNEDINIQFKAYNSPFTHEEQQQFCKILVRI